MNCFRCKYFYQWDNVTHYFVRCNKFHIWTNIPYQKILPARCYFQCVPFRELQAEHILYITQKKEQNYIDYLRR